jgi:hypothetical protein
MIHIKGAILSIGNISRSLQTVSIFGFAYTQKKNA